MNHELKYADNLAVNQTGKVIKKEEEQITGIKELSSEKRRVHPGAYDDA